MRARRKKSSIGSTVELSQNGTPLRQTSISELFKNSKGKTPNKIEPMKLQSTESFPPKQTRIMELDDSQRTTEINCLDSKNSMQTQNCSLVLHNSTESIETNGSASSDGTIQYEFDHESVEYNEMQPNLSHFENEPSGTEVDTEILILNDPNNFEDCSEIHNNFNDRQLNVGDTEKVPVNCTQEAEKIGDKTKDMNLGNPSDYNLPYCSTPTATSPYKRKIAMDNQPSSSTETPKKQRILSGTEELSNSTETARKSLVTLTEKKPPSSFAQIPKTPEKSSPLSPSKRGYSPNGSPYRSIKNLKAVDGKRLQVKQMEELVKLFKAVMEKRHLKYLLSKEESEVLRQFCEMSDNNRYVLMKLFIWKRTWYNIFDFCKKANIMVGDDKDKLAIFEYLRDTRLVDTDYKGSAGMLELLNVLNGENVKSIFKELGGKWSPGKTKEECINILIRIATTQVALPMGTSLKDRIMNIIEKKMGFCIKIKEKTYNALCSGYTLATFTNNSFEKIQDYFFNVVSGKCVFPVSTEWDFPVFRSREAFLGYVKALEVGRALEEAMKNKREGRIDIFKIGNELFGKLKSMAGDSSDECFHAETPHLKRFTAKHVYVSLLTMCCKELFSSRKGKPVEVEEWLNGLLEMFPTSGRLAKWVHLLVNINVRHLKSANYERAAKLLIEVLSKNRDEVGEIDLYTLGDLSKQLKSSKKYPISQMYHDKLVELVPRPINIDHIRMEQIDSQCVRSEIPGKKRMYIKKLDGEMTVRGVEQTALEYYKSAGYPEGIHCEGTIYRSLMMLFFWDLIYHPSKIVPATFLSSLQTAPLDMFSPYFYKNRKELIDQRIEEIADQWPEQQLIQFATSNWENHSDKTSAFGEVINCIATVQRAEDLIKVIPRKALAGIFKRLLTNLRAFSKGMPDLLVWNIDERMSKFVEVKGEGDSLSIAQKLWLNHLHENGAQVEVCLVHSMGSKRKIIKKASVPTP